jgi:iron(III) transport system substrate-binding protein
MNTTFVGTKLLILGMLIFQSAASAWAQAKKPVSLTELAAYTGADREQRLLAGAKAEGKVVWYTSLAGSSYKELAKGFETKYPGIKIEAYRGTSTDIMTRISAEAQAKQILADVLETTVPPLSYLRDNKLLVPYTSPSLNKYPASTKANAGRGLIYWAVDRETYSGVGYNTNLIPASAVPKNYGDLLNPRAQRKNWVGFKRNRRASAWGYAQAERGRVHQETQDAGRSFAGCFRASDGGLGSFGRSSALADYIPRPCSRAQK